MRRIQGLFLCIFLTLLLCLPSVLSYGAADIHATCMFENYCTQDEVDLLVADLEDISSKVSSLRGSASVEGYDDIVLLVSSINEVLANVYAAKEDEDYEDMIVLTDEARYLYYDAEMRYKNHSKPTELNSYVNDIIFESQVYITEVKDHPKYGAKSSTNALITDAESKIVKAQENLFQNDYEDSIKLSGQAKEKGIQALEDMKKKQEDMDCTSGLNQLAKDGCEEGCKKCSCGDESGPTLDRGEITSEKKCQKDEGGSTWESDEDVEDLVECFVEDGASTEEDCGDDDDPCDKCFCGNSTAMPLEYDELYKRVCIHNPKGKSYDLEDLSNCNSKKNSNLCKFNYDEKEGTSYNCNDVVKEYKYCLLNPQTEKNSWSFYGMDECKPNRAESACRCGSHVCGPSSIYNAYCCDLDVDGVYETCSAEPCTAFFNATAQVIDLAVTEIKLSADTIFAGDFFDITIRVSNVGTMDSSIAHTTMVVEELNIKETEQVANLGPAKKNLLLTSNTNQSDEDIELEFNVLYTDSGQQINYTPKEYPSTANFTFEDIVISTPGEYKFVFNVGLSSVVLEDSDLSNNGLERNISIIQPLKELECVDRYCDPREHNTCCKDCGCSAGFECEENQCAAIPQLECKINSDCKSSNSCAYGLCNLLTNTCEYDEILMCFNGDACCPKSCSYEVDYDCRPENTCGDGVCQETESVDNCCFDCGCDFGKTCVKNQCTAESFDDITLKGVRGDFFFGENASWRAITDPAEMISLIKEQRYPIFGSILAIIIICMVLIFLKKSHLSGQELRIQQYIRQLEAKGYNDGQIQQYLKRYNYSDAELKRLMK